MSPAPPSDGTASTGTRLTRLLPNELVTLLERLRVQALRAATGRGRGDQLSGRGGASIDFADYRDYTPGDDLRFVDWNIFSRLERPYLKLFRREEERHLVVLIDISRSMAYADKLTRACELAAGFAVMALHANDRLSIWAVAGDGRDQRLAATRGRASLRRAFAAIEGLEHASGTVPIERAIEAMLARHRGHGVCVVLSDLLTDGDLKRSVGRLAAQGLEPALIQILAPAEIDPDIVGDVRLVDCESAGTLDVSGVGDLLDLYQRYKTLYQDQLAEWSTTRGGRFLPVSSADSAAAILAGRLRRAGWIA
jgi:uncharacterized protein (DUF58 family)